MSDEHPDFDRRACKRPVGNRHDWALIRNKICYACEVDRLTTEVRNNKITIGNQLGELKQQALLWGQDRDALMAATAEVTRKATVVCAVNQWYESLHLGSPDAVDTVAAESDLCEAIEKYRCDTVSGNQSSDFSRFIREGTAEEKQEVFERVIDESNRAQRDVAESKQWYKCWNCGQEYPEPVCKPCGLKWNATNQRPTEDG